MDLFLNAINLHPNEIRFSDISFESSFSALIFSVWFHEAAHAWFQTNFKIYQSDWGYIIEESLAQAYSINGVRIRPADKIFPVDMDLFIRRASGSQRFPYNSWAFWKDSLEDVLFSWRDSEKEPWFFSGRRSSLRRNYSRNIFDLLYKDIQRINRRNETSISSDHFWKLKAMELLHCSVSK